MQSGESNRHILLLTKRAGQERDGEGTGRRKEKVLKGGDEPAGRFQKGFTSRNSPNMKLFLVSVKKILHSYLERSDGVLTQRL